jgi:hypothetical protein
LGDGESNMSLLSSSTDEARSEDERDLDPRDADEEGSDHCFLYLARALFLGILFVRVPFEFGYRLELDPTVGKDEDNE